MAKRPTMTARAAATIGEGNHQAGVPGLFLRVRGASRAWVFRWKRNGRVRELGLGGLSDRSLAEARKVALEMRRALARGEDPARVLRPHGADATFAEVAEDLIGAKSAGWRNAKHRAQWRNTLRDYAFPVLGRLRPAEVTIEHVLAALRPIWTTRPETASRLRQRIEAVLDRAAALGLRERGSNPAAWRGNLAHLLPPSRSVRPVRHHAALPYREIPAAMGRLEADPGIPAACVRWVVLTACRSMEARGARWDEIDAETGTWTIPGSRTKTGRPHTVMLSGAALEVLERAKAWRSGPLIFPGERGVMADQTLTGCLRKHAEGKPTVHGLRSTFRTWAAECTRHPREVAELALGHVVGSSVERAYQRSDLRERRRALMEGWARFLVARPGTVITLKGARRKG